MEDRDGTCLSPDTSASAEGALEGGMSCCPTELHLPAVERVMDPWRAGKDMAGILFLMPTIFCPL